MRTLGRLNGVGEGSTRRVAAGATFREGQVGQVTNEVLGVLLLATLLALPTVAVAADAPGPGTAAKSLDIAGSASSLAPADAATRTRVETAFGKLPLYFIENRGQLDPRAAYYVQGATNSLYFTKTGVVFVLTSRAGEGRDSEGRPMPVASSPQHPSEEAPAIRRFAIHLDFEGANPEVKLVGRERTSAIVNEFKGAPSEWKTGLPTYAEVVYEELWPGIDLVYGSESGRPKYSFHVKPGADPGRIRLIYRGASRIQLTQAGRLAVETPAGAFAEEAPYAYQEGQGETRTEVAAAFAPEADAASGDYRFGFRVGAYDRTRPLVLDPLVQAYCGFIGGTTNDYAYGMTVDSLGNAYIVGHTSSTVANGFPAAGSWDTTLNGGSDAFVAKINAAGTALVYCGYLGGSGGEIAYNVVVDSSFAAYVAGDTTSPTGGAPSGRFPVVVGPYLTTNGGDEAFVAKISADGSALVYCGLIGGTQDDLARGIAVDDLGNAYVVGHTASTPAQSFPVTGGPSLTHGGGTDDVFVAKIGPTGGLPLLYSGYIGGSGEDRAFGIALDAAHAAYVVGYTTSSNLPVTGGPFSNFNGGSFNGGTYDALVAKINPAGNALSYCFYLGGSGDDNSFFSFEAGIAVDATSGEAYVVGDTNSSPPSFPATVGPYLTRAGSTDAFVARINAAGTALVYCGYIGGTGSENGEGIALDGAGNAYVVGYTASTNFPVVGTFGNFTGGSFNGGTYDAFVAKVNPAGTALVYSFYLGGSQDDNAYGVAVDSSGDAYVAGGTDSSEAQGFPVVAGSWDTTFAVGGTHEVFAAKITGNPTAVTLMSFEARAADGAVDLAWQTGSELDNLGFHLHRALSASGPWTRITSSLIPGLGSSPLGASYSWRDSGLVNGQLYLYRLEDVDSSSVSTFHGPVSAMPSAETPPLPMPGKGGGPGSGGSGGSGSDDSSCPAWVLADYGSASTSAYPLTCQSYGEPSATELRVLSHSSRGAVVELLTSGFVALREPSGSVRAFIPGFDFPRDPSFPALPFRRALIDALVGRGVRLDSVEAFSLVPFPGLRPSAVGSFEVAPFADGTVRPSRRPASLLSVPRRYRPEEQARLAQIVFQGEEKRAVVEISPLRFDPSHSGLVLARRVRVTLSFSGLEPSERALGGSRGRRHREQRRRRDRVVMAKLSTSRPGLYRVRFEDVSPSGWQAVSSDRLRLSRLGQAIAYHLEPSANRFGPGSSLYFVSPGEASNPYGVEAVFELELASGGITMPVDEAKSSGPAVSTYLARSEWEQDRYYQAGLLEAPSLWLWDTVLSPGSTTHPFSLGALASGESTLDIYLQGASDFYAAPDHHVRVAVNGYVAGEASWDGKAAHTISVSLPPGVLREGENELTVENVGDTGASYSMVFLDRFAVSYERRAVAEAGVLEGRFGESGTVSVTGLAAGSFLVQTSPETTWLDGAQVTAAGASFRVEAARSYLAVSPEAVLEPKIRRPSHSALRSTRNRADYLLIGPGEFLAAAEPLLQRRRSQNLWSRAVAIEEIYDEFGYGEARPEALKEFLEYAYHHWQKPSVRYVVLFGDATYDVKDNLQTGVVNRIPALMVKTSYLWTASDPSYAAVNGEDRLPDLAVGRLPAASLEQAQQLVAKVLAYEESGQDLSGLAVLVADDPDAAGDFEADSDEIASRLTGREVARIYLRKLGSAETRTAIVESLDRGASLLSYVGHGGIALWANENVFGSSDIERLRLQERQPIAMTMNCLNGYFHFPYFDSLAEAFVKAEGKGAVAAFSPSGLSLNGPAHLYQQALVDELTSSQHSRLGDAVLAAQRTYAESGAFPELLAIYHLFGDPALVIH